MLKDLRTLKESSRATAWAHAHAADWERVYFMWRWNESVKEAKALSDDRLLATITNYLGPWESVCSMGDHTHTPDEVAELMLGYHTYNVELRTREMKDAS